jgi:flagellar biosynthesis anti-sigma factor FlgM
MKVEKKSVSSSYAAASSAYGKTQRVGAPTAVQDSVEVSSSAGLFQKALDAVSQVPDVRAEAISGIQQEVANGTYNRDERQVAYKMIQDSIDTPL